MLLHEAKKYIEDLTVDTIPMMLMGPPGIGKSSIIKQVCQKKGWDLIDLRLSQLNPIDLRGLPYLDAEKREAVWLKPECLPTEGVGILFLDEFNTAATATMQAAYELLLDRKIGNYIFPEKWRIVAAGNREEDGASVNIMPTPLANRMIHFDIEASVDDWKQWAIGKIDQRVVGFLDWRPELLATLPKKEEKAFPTPRSWEFVSRILAIYKSDENDIEEVLQGTIGKGATKEFLGFLAIYHDLPDVMGILKGTVSTVPAKNKSDVLYALCSALVHHLKAEYIDNFLRYTLKLEPEFSTMVVKDAGRAGWKENINKAPVFMKQWVPLFGEYLFD